MSASETVTPPVTGTGTTETVPSSVASTDPPTVGVFSGSGDRDCSYCCYYVFSFCSCSIDPDCFTATCIYRGLAWQLRVWGGYFTVCDHSTLLGTRHDCFCSPVGSLVLFLVFDAKGGERVDSGGVLIEGFVLFLCATFMHHVYFPALHFVTCVLVRYVSHMWSILSLLYIMSLNWF
jgi:hypothetical protein